MKKFIKPIILIFTICLFIIPDIRQVYAATDLKVTGDKTLTAKFNTYDNVTIAKGTTLTLADRAGEPVGITINKSLVVEEGGKITGDGILIFDRNATFSGITLYYKYNNEYLAIPKGLSFAALGNDADYKAEFYYDSSKKIYVLKAEFKGGDPFELNMIRQVTVLKKETYQLDLSGITEGVKWSSDNKSVATVSSKGLVTAKAVGKAVITAEYNNKKYTCDIEVANKGLSLSEVYMNKGDIFYIQLYGTEVKSVSSSNKKVAKVTKKLKITAVADGTCTITVKGTNGKKYKCTVYVGNAGPVNNNNNPDNNQNNSPDNNQNNNQNNNPDNNQNNNAVTIVNNTVKYSVADTAKGTFKTNATPDNILSGFNSANGSTGLNHPNGIATDGTHFVVCDTWNNRVLIYNSLPQGGEKPDVVLGQPDFNSFDAGNGDNRMNWPVDATFANGKLFITDTNNYRVLVYNKIPTKNGTKPDKIITLISSNLSAAWPWSIWSDGNKLVLTCTLGGRVAIWNNADDAAAGKYADIILEGMGTPRTIISDGNYLMIGDHNATINGVSKAGSYVWTSFPTSSSDKPDFVADNQYSGEIIDGNMYLRDASSNYYVYDGLLDTPTKKAKEELFVNDCCKAGDCNDLLFINGKTYASCYNSSYIAIYDGKVTSKNVNDPAGFIGADKKVTSMNVETGLYQNPVSATDGTSLVLVDDFNRMIAIYKKLPDDNNVRADYEYYFQSADDYPLDIAIDETGKMYVLTQYAILVWNKVPVNGEQYDERYDFGSNRGLGRNNNGTRITVDTKYIYVSSENDNKIYRFDKSAKSFKLSDASASIACNRARNIYSNGQYLVVTNQEANKIDIYNTSDLTLYGTVESNSIGSDTLRINRPGDAIILPNGQFVIADTGENLVLVYSDVDAAIKNYNNYSAKLGDNKSYRVSNYNGGALPVSEITSISTGVTLFTPSDLSYRDGHLWVGEFKFSSRLIRYDLK